MTKELELEVFFPAGPDQSRQVDHGLVALTEAIEQLDSEAVAHGFLGGPHGYGARFENDVFVMRPYYWGDCDCGFEERSEKWHSANPHTDDCFKTILRAQFAEYDESSGFNEIERASDEPDNMKTEIDRSKFGTMTIRTRTSKGERIFEEWRHADSTRNKEHERLTYALYEKFGLPKSKYVWHCTCGTAERAKTYFETEGHYPACALMLPNFQHKPTGFEARWYKWIGRDMELSNDDGVDIASVFSECVNSLSAPRR